MNRTAVNAIFLTIVGCMLNNIFLEYIIQLDKGAGHLLTFCQFLFIALHGFAFTSKFGKVNSKIPRREYLKLNLLFFVNTVTGNWMFAFHIPVPLMMIFRSGSLIATMLLSTILLKKRYSLEKYISVALVTLGIIICTLYSHKKPQVSCTDCSEMMQDKIREENIEHSFWFVVGVIISMAGLLISASLGIFQDQLYQKYGKHPQEALYYTHLYGLVGFVSSYSNLKEHAGIATNSELLYLPMTEIGLPCMWIFIILNSITQYTCINSVYVLFTECQSLTVTLVVTLRKLFSLLFSVIYFGNPFTIAHWLGTVLVFSGTLLFSETHHHMGKIFGFKTIRNKGG